MCSRVFETITEDSGSHTLLVPPRLPRTCSHRRRKHNACTSDTLVEVVVGGPVSRTFSPSRWPDATFCGCTSHGRLRDRTTVRIGWAHGRASWLCARPYGMQNA